MMMYKWLLLVTALQTIIVERVTGYFLPNVTKPFRSKGLRITCSMPSEVIFYNYNLNQIGGCNLQLKMCIPPEYAIGQNLIYRLAANSSTAWVDIISVDRTRDQGLWRCEDGNNQSIYETLNLTVYSSPSGISFVPPLPPSADLAEDNVTLECKTNSCCYPEPLIAWYYQTTSGLALLNVGTTRRRNSTGNCTQQEQMYYSSIELSRGTNFPGNIPVITTFQCGITHPVFDVMQFSGNSNNVTFAVYVTNIALSPAKSIITFLEGDEETLVCTSSLARPQPIIRWWVDGVLATNGSREKTTANGSLHSVTSELRLILTKIYQNKQIYCDSWVDGQPSPVISNISTINVWYKPSTPLVEPVNMNFPWLENRTGILQCVTADRGNTPASVLWTSSRGIKDNDENLVFRNLINEDHGKAVTCQLQNNFTILKNINVVSPNVILNVEYTPTIILTPADNQIRVKETWPLTVTCTGTGNPDPMVEWLGRAPPNNILHIPNVWRNSTGTYTCRAGSTSTNFGNVALRREKSAVIIIEYAPDVVVYLSGPTVINSTVVLTCIPLGEPSQYTFNPWVHKVGETEIRKLTGTNTATTSTLTLSNISIEDIGTYICTVGNSITGLDGQVNQTGHSDIFVHGLPFIENKDIVFIGVVNTSAEMEIPFYSNPPSRTITFYRGSNIVEVTNTSDTLIFLSSFLNTMTFYGKEVFINGQIAVLRLRTVKTTDFGEYTAVIFNDIGSTSRTFLLSSGEPEKPDNFHITDVQENQVTLEWLSGDHRGFDQTFVVQISMNNIMWMNASLISAEKKEGWLSATITGLKSNTAYYFRIYSFNVNGSGDFADVHFATRTLKEYASLSDIGASIGIGFGGFLFGIIGTISVITIRKRFIATTKYSSTRTWRNATKNYMT